MDYSYIAKNNKFTDSEIFNEIILQSKSQSLQGNTEAIYILSY